MIKTRFTTGFAAFAIGCTLSCTQVKITSSPKNLYFSAQDTIIIAGLSRPSTGFVDIANVEMEDAFSRCNVSAVINTYAYQGMLMSKAGMPELDLTKRESFEQLERLGISGYLVDAQIVSANGDNSLLTFSQKNGNSVSETNPDPWIAFRFTIHHIKTKTTVLRSDVQVRNSSLIVGENVDDNIGVNKGLNVNRPKAELKQALTKLLRVCHCR
ncbi:MAG TPA: hypothetical protein VGD31_02600 [Sphingobacteriaceae bacterium]